MPTSIFHNASTTATTTKVIDPTSISVDATQTTELAVKNSQQLESITEDYIMGIGTNSAKGLTELTTKILSNVSATNGGVMTQKLDELIDTTKNMSIENFQAGRMKKFMNKIMGMKDHAMEQFQTANDRVNILVSQLEKEKRGQENDRKMIDSLAEQNYNYCKAILAEIEDAKAKYELLGNAIAGFGTALDFEQNKARDELQTKYDLIEKKLVDLEATKVLSMNMEPKLKLMKQGAISLVATFDNIVLRVVPMYMQQFSAYLIAIRQDQASKLSDKTITMFNEGIVAGSDLAAKNAESIAKLSQRQLIDADTLRKDHANVVSSLDKVRQIAVDARTNRQNIMAEIQAMEQDTLNAFAKK